MFADNTISMTKWMAAEVITLLTGIAFLIYSSFTPETYPIVLGIICLIAFLIIIYVNPSYFYFNDENAAKKDMIEIRSVQAFPFFRKYKQYGILKKTIKDFCITEELFGLRKFLSVTIRGVDPSTKKTVEKTIDGINISILKKAQISELEKTLTKYFVAKRH